ncbi:MAG: hypothetical protein HY241_02490 [Actinobacteria bacterium]|nr:hypothetical protein [Actinomycetota bacterium]
MDVPGEAAAPGEPVAWRGHPFGIGVLAVARRMDPTVRSEERVAVAVAAARIGYFLLDTVEVDVNGADGGPPVGAVVARLRALAVRTQAEAFFVRGPLDWALLEPMADELRIVIHDAGGPLTALVQTPGWGQRESPS